MSRESVNGDGVLRLRLRRRKVRSVERVDWGHSSSLSLSSVDSGSGSGRDSELCAGRGSRKRLKAGEAVWIGEELLGAKAKGLGLVDPRSQRWRESLMS